MVVLTHGVCVGALNYRLTLEKTLSTIARCKIRELLLNSLSATREAVSYACYFP